jgi:lipoprotein-anchoring transpeptidase ErfK/SrfK
MNANKFNRRDFLKIASVGLGTMGLRPWSRLFNLPKFPQAEKLGRVTVGKVELKASPDYNSQTIGALFEDAVVPWVAESVGPRPYRRNQRWVETPDGYLWAAEVQPVANQHNTPLEELPQTSLAPGMWVEVSVPYVDLIQANPPARAPWLKNRIETGMPPRWVYSQISWVDEIKKDEDGQTWYRLNEQFGYGDIFWGVAEAFRPLTQDEISPISPGVEDKRVLVNVTDQTMACFEGNTEVYFTRVSTGVMTNASGERVDDWGTPLGRHRIWRKAVSLPLSGGSSAVGWDLPAVGWISLFVGTGVAIHSTFWHNNYGEPTSRGCVNARPEDAKWVFRWMLPEVPYDPGDVTVSMPGGTLIEVIET